MKFTHIIVLMNLKLGLQRHHWSKTLLLKVVEVGRKKNVIAQVICLMSLIFRHKIVQSQVQKLQSCNLYDLKFSQLKLLHA